MSSTTRQWDRREAGRGDVRRQALLDAVRELLDGGTAWERITVAQVTERAGVTRSGFYFYFPNLAMAVAALAEGLFVASNVANTLIGDTSQAPYPRIRRALGGLFDAIDAERETFAAALAARAAEPSLRAMWESVLVEYARPVSTLIEAERAAGRAPGGVDADVLARTLLVLNERSVELYALGAVADRAAQVDVLTTIWVRSIYGTDPEEQP